MNPHRSPTRRIKLDDALALVTASTGGIGKEITTTLAREGVTVIINGRTPASVEAAIADISPSPEMAHYSATKTMQLSLSRNLAELTKGTTVTVNTVMPGSIKTEGVAKLVQEIFPGMSLEEAEKRFKRENRPSSLIERLIDPKEIADFVTYLSSPLASAINGAALRIDGGLVRCVF